MDISYSLLVWLFIAFWLDPRQMMMMISKHGWCRLFHLLHCHTHTCCHLHCITTHIFPLPFTFFFPPSFTFLLPLTLCCVCHTTLFLYAGGATTHLLCLTSLHCGKEDAILYVCAISFYCYFILPFISIVFAFLHFWWVLVWCVAQRLRWFLVRPSIMLRLLDLLRFIYIFCFSTVALLHDLLFIRWHLRLGVCWRMLVADGWRGVAAAFRCCGDFYRPIAFIRFSWSRMSFALFPHTACMYSVWERRPGRLYLDRNFVGFDVRFPESDS